MPSFGLYRTLALSASRWYGRLCCPIVSLLTSEAPTCRPQPLSSCDLHQIFSGGWGEPARHHEQLIACRYAKKCAHKASNRPSTIGNGRKVFRDLFGFTAPPKSPERDAVKTLDRLSDLGDKSGRGDCLLFDENSSQDKGAGETSAAFQGGMLMLSMMTLGPLEDGFSYRGQRREPCVMRVPEHLSERMAVAGSPVGEAAASGLYYCVSR